MKLIWQLLFLLIAAAASAQPVAPQDVRDTAWKLASESDSGLIRKLIGGGDDSVEILVAAGRHEPAALRTVAYILGVISTPKSCRALLPLLGDPDSAVRDEAVLAFVYANRPVTFGIEGEMSSDADFGPVAKLGSAAIPGLVLGLQHRQRSVRWTAAHVFRLIRDPKIVGPLLDNFGKLEEYELMEASMALVPYADKRIPPVLISRISVYSWSMRGSIAGYALQKMGRRVLPFLAAALRASKSASEMPYILGTARGIDEKGALAMLLDAARSTNVIARRFAANQLPLFRDVSIVAALKKLAKDRDVEVRRIAGFWLDKIAKDKSWPRVQLGGSE